MSDCRDRNPRNMGMVCSLPAGHASPHAFGDGGTWPLSAETAQDCSATFGSAECGGDHRDGFHRDQLLGTHWPLVTPPGGTSDA